jgi:putative oxidoreductase
MDFRKIATWLLRVVAAIIMLQTLFFKFTGHPESVGLFTELGVEPWGRIGTGVIELAASILILIPSTTFVGASLAVGLMSGAIGAHLTVLGVSYGGNPLLFIYAVIVLIASLVLLYFDRDKIRSLVRKYRSQPM